MQMKSSTNVPPATFCVALNDRTLAHISSANNFHNKPVSPSAFITLLMYTRNSQAHSFNVVAVTIKSRVSH